VALLSCSAIKTLAQADAPQGEAVLSKLAKPVYPPIARTAHITGDLELKIEVKEDGTVHSASVLSGPPLLRQAALDSQVHDALVRATSGCERSRVRTEFRLRLPEPINQRPLESRSRHCYAIKFRASTPLVGFGVTQMG
jgi:hypothetical protein